VATIHGSIACPLEVVVLTGPEHVHDVCPLFAAGAGEEAVNTLRSSDHVIHKLPFGATETMGN
jgi:hypothetical protein